MNTLLKILAAILIVILIIIAGIFLFGGFRDNTAAPTTVPTTAVSTAATTTPTTTITAATTTPISVVIPTDAEMQAIFGFDKLGIKPVFSGSDIPWEPAKWNLQWVSDKLLALKLLQGWEFTVTREDGVVAVYYGDDTVINVKGATMRFLAAYNTPDSIWAQDKAEMLKREDAFGMSRTPAYHTVLGN